MPARLPRLAALRSLPAPIADARPPPLRREELVSAEAAARATCGGDPALAPRLEPLLAAAHAAPMEAAAVAASSVAAVCSFAHSYSCLGSPTQPNLRRAS